MTNFQKIVKIVCDLITIIGPTVSSTLLVLGFNEVIPVFESWLGIAATVLGYVSSAASLIYNQVTGQPVIEKSEAAA